MCYASANTNNNSFISILEDFSTPISPSPADNTDESEGDHIIMGYLPDDTKNKQLTPAVTNSSYTNYQTDLKIWFVHFGYNFCVHVLIFTELFMFAKAPGLNTATCQYSVIIVAPPTGNRK